MMMALKNPNILGAGMSGSQGAMLLQADGSYLPNTNVQVDDEATLAKRQQELQ